jgi:SET family sugar efflux transporter-like MFS transporter
MATKEISMTEASAVGRLLTAARVLFGERELRALFVCNVLLGLGSSFVMPFMSMFGTLEVGMALTTFSAFMTTTTAANIFISSVLARWSDRLRSRKVVLLLGAAAGALGYFGYAFVRDPWLLLLTATVLLGVASLSFSQLFAHARERLERSAASPAETPLYMNAFRMAFAAAWTLGPALAAHTLRGFGFRGLFLGAASFYVLLFLLVLGFVSASPPSPARPSAALPSTPLATQVEAGAPSALWARPDVLPWLIALIFLFAAQSIAMSNMSLYVLHELGGTEAHVGFIFSLAPMFEVPFMLYVGLVASRVEAAQLIRWSMALSVVYFVALVLVQAPWQIYPLQALSAAIVAVTSGIAITFFQNKLPGQLGAATNLYVNAVRIGSTSGYLLFGPLASRFGHRGAYVACAVLSLFALLATTGLIASGANGLLRKPLPSSRWLARGQRRP